MKNYWKQEIDGSFNVVLKLDCGPETKQNTLGSGALTELDNLLDILKPTSLIIASAKPDSFCAGADIDEIRKIIDDPTSVEELLTRVHSIFLKLHRATYPVVAAVSGECLGGGLELAMVCHGRVVAKTPKTRLALPEVRLGIIPGFGGTQVLPRLVGLRKALEVIVGQRTLSAADALKCGLADEAAAPEDLIQSAQTLAKRLGSGQLVSRYRRNSSVFSFPFKRSFILSASRKLVLRETKGAYPAPLKAIEAIAASNRPIEEGLLAEKAKFIECVKTEEAKNLVDIFFLRKDARSRNWSRVDSTAKTAKLGVLGAGLMGRGIAYSAISAGIPVALHDAFPGSAHGAVKWIEDTLVKEVIRKKMTPDQAAAKRDLLSISWGEKPWHFSDVDFVIEAIKEDVADKHKLLRDIEKIVHPNVVIATNTSSLLPSEIAEPLEYKDRFCAMHFFNPAEKMELVEIAGTPDTDPFTLAKTIALTKALGKTPVVLDKECPGLVVNRILLRGVARAMLKLLQNGVDPWALDEHLERYGFMMGPFKTTDLVGFDTADHVLKLMGHYYPAVYPGDVLELDLKKDKQLLGSKSGRGFYFWNKGRVGQPNPGIIGALGVKRSLVSQPEFVRAVAEDVLSEMTKEAKSLLEEGALRDVGMIDLTMILGAGIAPNKRGVLGKGVQLNWGIMS